MYKNANKHHKEAEVLCYAYSFTYNVKYKLKHFFFVSICFTQQYTYIYALALFYEHHIPHILDFLRMSPYHILYTVKLYSFFIK